MKRLCCLSMCLALTLGLLLPAHAEKKGPIVDKIYVNVRMKQEIGLKDTAEGLTDIFFFGVDGPVILGLDQATRDKLDLYTVPGGSWSLLFNPIPNAAPYLVTADGAEQFNPYAIRDVRFAMNFLINRKYIVDEILAGAGMPTFTMATPGQPGTYKYNLLASRMGFTDEGDESRAIETITNALTAASELPELQGRLVKGDPWWLFDEEPVTVKFLIRVDDPQGRLKEGEYVARQIEKTGIKVERLLWDRAKCSKAVYGGNPADYEWNIYTEGWGAGATRAFWEHIVSQMYAPWYGYMPGGANPDYWNYANDGIDEVTKKAYTGNFVTDDEYWELALEGLRLGLEDAVRIYVATQNQYYAANKARFKQRMLYGLGDGLNQWSLLSADTPDGIVRITGFSAKGSLFMHAWDPVGEDGFSDTYSLVCADPVGLPSMFESPATAIFRPMLAVPQDVSTQVGRDAAGEVVGHIAVPSEAVTYNSATNAWESVGDGTTAMSTATYSFRFGTFHHGRRMSVADFLYTDAFTTEWATQDGEDDRFYDAVYESGHSPSLEIDKGTLINSDNTLTSFYDYNFPASQERVAAMGAPSLSVLKGRPGVTVAWEILEALAHMVAEGSASGTVYSFTFGDLTEVDLLRPSCVADIRAKLEELAAARHVPDSIRDYISADEAVAGYEAAIQWIDEKGHAMIGPGPFYIETYDPETNYMELIAFRDEGYPFTADYWPAELATTILQIDSVDLPAMFSAQEGPLPVSIMVSEVLYPNNTATPAEQGEVSVMLITDDGERTYAAAYVEPGVFQAEIPVESLSPGTYTILIDTALEGAMPASFTATTVLY